MSTGQLTDAQKFTIDVLWVAISQIVLAIVNIACLPVITKSYPVEQYGIWTQVNATVGILAGILSLYLGTALIRYVSGMDDKEKRRYDFGTMLATIALFSGVILLCFLLFKDTLSLVVFSDIKYAPYILLTVIWAILETLLAFSLVYLQSRRMIRQLVIIQITVTIAKLIMIIIIAGQGYSLMWVIGGIIVLLAVFLTGTLLIIIRDTGLLGVRFERLPRYLSFSFPYIPSAFLFFVIAYGDRYFIAHMLDLKQLGIYAASYSLGNIILFISMPIVFILYPQLVSLWESNEKIRLRLYLESSLRLFIALAVPASIGLFILSQPLLNIMTTPDYAAGGVLVLLLAFGTLFCGIYQITVCIICLCEQTKWLPVALVIPVTVNIVINLILLPLFGIIAAAYAMLSAYFVLALIVSIWARRIFKYSFFPVFVLKIVIATALMALSLSIIKLNGIIYLVIATVAGVIIYSCALLLFRTMSKDDRIIIGEIISGFKTKFHSGS